MDLASIKNEPEYDQPEGIYDEDLFLADIRQSEDLNNELPLSSDPIKRELVSDAAQDGGGFVHMKRDILDSGQYALSSFGVHMDGSEAVKLEYNLEPEIAYPIMSTIEKPKYVRKNNYSCEICGKKCASITAHENHLRVHSGEKPFSCDVCLKTYRQKIQLKEHIKATHSEVKPYKCHICAMEFSYSQAYKRHLLWHKGRQLSCSQCKYMAFRKSQLDNHYQKIHIEQRPFCDICNRTFQVEKHYKVHIERKHTVKEDDTLADGDEEQVCIYCSFKSANKKEFLEHGKMHPAFDNYACKICEKSFKWKQSLKEHIAKHGPKTITCMHCDYTTSSRVNLRVHIKIHAAVKTLKCRYCVEVFYDQNSYTLHKNMKHKLRESGDFKVNKCDSCLRFFSSRKIYDKHIKNSSCIVYECFSCDFKTAHAVAWSEHQKEMGHNDNFICEYCNRVFNESSEYLEHTEIHPSHEYECTFCIQKYKLQESFIRHLKMSHREESLLQCPKCDFTSYNESFFNKHKFRHSDKNRFVCDVCQYRFRDHQHLRTHIENSHSNSNSPKVQIYDCDKCSKKFSSQENLQKHLYIHNQLVFKTCSCTLCEDEFENEFELKKHVKSVHNLESICHLCSKLYHGKSSKKSLKRHMESAHFEYAGKVQHACSFCDKVYYGGSSRKSLKRHLATIHKDVIVKEEINDDTNSN